MPHQSQYQRIFLRPINPLQSADNQSVSQLLSSVIPLNGSPVAFNIPNLPVVPHRPQQLFLRISIAGNHQDEKVLSVRLAHTKKQIGSFDLRYPVPLQVFQLEIPLATFDEILDQGIEFTQTAGQENLELFTAKYTSVNLDWDTFCPHLFVTFESVDREKALLNSLCSMRTLAPFGWEEGCSTDALDQLRHGPHHKIATSALRNRFDAIGALDHNWDGKAHMHSIESTLPFAALANLDPHHPVLYNVIDFWDSRLRDHGVIADFSTTAEGAYTVAYPMAVFSNLLDRKDLAVRALDQLRLRITGLTDNHDLYLRQRPDNLSRSFKNWSRAYAWTMLGIIRTINALNHDLDTSDLRAEFIRITQIALQYQRSDGLWSCYLDQPQILPDTAGSAGIAAAIAEGVRSKILPPEFSATLPTTRQTLLSFVTPDGLLTGVSQSNKGGDALQESNYRVILSMGAGLIGQLFQF